MLEEELKQGPQSLVDAAGRRDHLSIPRQIDPFELHQKYLCSKLME